MWSWTRTATNPTCRNAALNSTRAANMPCCILIPDTLLHYTTLAANLQGSTLYYPLSPAQPCCLLAILCSPVGRALQAAFYYSHLLHYTLLHSGRVTLPLAMALNSLLSALPCPPIRLAHCLSTPLHHSALPPPCPAICALQRTAPSALQNENNEEPRADPNLQNLWCCRCLVQNKGASGKTRSRSLRP